MSRGVQIKLMNTSIELDSPDNMLFKSSVRTAFLLSDQAPVSLAFQNDGRLKYCRTNESGQTFILPDGWEDFQFVLSTGSPPPRSPTPTPYPIEQHNRLKKVGEEWEDRVFMIFGRNGCQGTAILITDQKVVTAAHLSFKVGESYTLKGTNNRKYQGTCEFISNAVDFAILLSSEMPEVSTPTDQLFRGSDFYVLGYPKHSVTDLPSITKGVIEGVMQDNIHFIGSPGSRRGYSGAPVFGEGGYLAGLLLGSTSSINIDTTLRECIATSAEQNYSRILGIQTIHGVYKQGRSDDES